MANMSYCRFENTAQALRDCVDNWTAEDRMRNDRDFDEDADAENEFLEEADDANDAGLNEYEKRGHAEIRDLAETILRKEGYRIEKAGI